MKTKLFALCLALLGYSASAACLAVNQPAGTAYFNWASGASQIYDSMESYTDAAAVNSLNGGTLWNGAYTDRANAFGVVSQDDLESYSDATQLNTLNLGIGFNGAYVDRLALLGVQAADDMESYSDTAAVNGLNGSGGWQDAAQWNGAYVDR